MKKRNCLILFPILLLLLTTTNNSFANKSSSDRCLPLQNASNADNTWIVTLGGSGGESSEEMLYTSDGGYLLVGKTSTKIYIIKVGEDGYIDWENTYGGQSSDYVNGIIEVEDGYVIAGNTSSSGIGDGDGLVMKLNNDGSIAWQKTFGHIKSDRFSSIVQTNDNGFLLTGSTQNLAPRNDWEGLAVKLNSDGSLAWQKTYGGIDSDHLGKVILMNDGKYLLFGNTSSFGLGTINLWLLMLNPDGSIYWEKTYSGESALYRTFITRTKDGGYVISGHTYGEVSSIISHDGFLLKTNSSGDIVWQKAYGWLYEDMLLAVRETLDGGFIAIGMLQIEDSGDNDAWVLKMNSEGNPIWQKLYGGAVTDNFNFVMEYLDKSFTFFGTTNSFGSGQYDMWMVTTDENGDIGDCNFYSDGMALPSDIGTIVVTTSAASVQTSDYFYMNSSLGLNNVDLPITNICPENPFLYTFLPLISGISCTDFFDDFSKPASGWFVGEDEYGRYEYLNGEYRILNKDDRFMNLISAPTCALENYTIEVDARWVGSPGESYGILFGIIGNYDQYYLFDVSTDYQDFRLLRFDGNDYHTIVPITSSANIKSGTASNHLIITRNGNKITLEINGMVLGTWTDSNITGATYTGILSIPYTGYPNSDARFDNFAINNLQISRTAEQASGDSMKSEASPSKVISIQMNIPVPYNLRSPPP